MKRLPKAHSEGEALLALQLRVEGIAFEREYKALESRRYRWDFFIAPDLLIEVQGGTWNYGKSGHATGMGALRDCEKASLAAANGFRQVTATTAQVRNGEAIAWIKQAIARAA